MERMPGQLARRMKRRIVVWDDQVEDPRGRRGRRHGHHGLLNLLVLGFASGAHTLRHVEDLATDLGAVARRVFGATRRVSDTALYLLLQAQRARGLRETLLAQVKRMWRSKQLSHDAFPLGVVALDGKSVWTSTTKGLDGARESVDGRTVTWSLRMLNAVLVSSSVKPCLDVQLIPEKAGEPAAFRDMVKRLALGFPNFEVVTGDAGLLCRESADVVRAAGKHYILGLKGNQPKLHDYAVSAFAALQNQARVETLEKRNGALVTRMLHTLVVHDVAEFDLKGAQEVWRVAQTTQRAGLAPVVEERYFVSSLPPRSLSPTEKLRAVRLHWGIQNNRHWTLDVAFKEDDHQPCQTSVEAIEVSCWLRALAYNLIAGLRIRGPKKDKRHLPWRRVMQLYRDLLLSRVKEEPLVPIA